MDLGALKSKIQQHMGDGLVTIVGSGLSCAEGLPGMAELARHRDSSVASAPDENIQREWANIVPHLSSRGLEESLLDFPPSNELEEFIRKQVASYVSSAENVVIADVFKNGRILRFTRLLKCLLRPPNGIQVITTNYDRLLEVAAEAAEIGVDTMFTGVFAGRLHERETRLSFCREVTLYKGKPRYIFADRMVLSKPHGSLDWFDNGGSPVRHCSPVPTCSPLIIPPGQNKFRNGYNSPFDVHRERANRAIDRASRFLIIWLWIQ